MAKPTTAGISPFRSITDLKDFNDDEVYDLVKEPSLTDPSQDEPIEALVARMMRGEITLGQHPPQYDFDGPVDPKVAFESMSAIQRDGFDIADIPGIVERADAAVKTLNVPPAPKPAPTPAPAPAPVPADLKQ